VKTVIIVDADLGFAFWLGHVLDQAGYYALPALSAGGASRLLTELGLTVDLIVINAEVGDAKSFIADSRLANPNLRVIAVLENPEASLPAFLQANLIEHKPAVIDDAARRTWVDTVQLVLSTRTEVG